MTHPNDDGSKAPDTETEDAPTAETLDEDELENVVGGASTPPGRFSGTPSTLEHEVDRVGKYSSLGRFSSVGKFSTEG